MTNTDPSAEEPLPQTETAEINAVQLGQLMTDLAACADISLIAVRRRVPGEAMQTIAPDRLDQIQPQLDDPDTAGVQLRYTFEGKAWIDTLSKSDPITYKLVRMATPQAEA